MDDKEYYSMMNRSNSALILQELVKKAQQKKAQEQRQNKTNNNSQNINNTEGRQSREDTEMLHEKKGDFKNEE